MTDTATTVSNGDECEDFRALWAIAAEDIRFFKSQQYSLTNYAHALFVAIAALHGSLRDGWLITIATAVLIPALVQMHALQKALRKARRLAMAGRQQLSRRLNEEIEKQFDVSPRDETKWSQPGDVVWILDGVLVGSCVVATMYVVLSK